MAWRIDTTREIKAPPRTVWRFYADPKTWAGWAHNTEAVSFAEPLAVGVEGRIKPQGGPEQTVRIVEFDEGRALRSEIRLPGAVMAFAYEVEPLSVGAQVRHEISMTGPMSAVYGLVLKRRNARQLPIETARLADLIAAEAD